jgi:hypothetical protein
MQKEALVAQSMVMLVMVGMMVWQRYRRTFKKWWQAWRAKPKRPCDSLCWLNRTSVLISA